MGNYDHINTPVQFLKSIGPKRAKAFEKIGIRTLQDLLFFFPQKYIDRTTLVTCSQLVNYISNGYEGEVTIIGEVVGKEVLRVARKHILKVIFKDKSGYFECVWFQGVVYLENKFNTGDIFAISAKPSVSKFGNIQFTHPDFDKVTQEENNEFNNTGKIIPIYKSVKELKAVNLGDVSLRTIIKQAVQNIKGEFEETLTEDLLRRFDILPIDKAVFNLHFPTDHNILQKAKFRFKFEELFYFELLIASSKNRKIVKSELFRFSVKSSLIRNFIESLKFQLTKSQIEVLHEIKMDLYSGKIMNRLLQGDVGSGKTIVALITILFAIDNGFQTVFMAPTEILAQQHYTNFSLLLNNFNIKIKLLTSGTTPKEKKEILTLIQNEENIIVVGTQALFESNVQFSKLGLIVIDEQHRFGVIQRANLIKKGIVPHTLIMSATPIPRTLSMTLYGELDQSVIKELPANRKQIKTILRGEHKLPEIFEFVKTKIKEGQQVFIVYPLVEESEKSELKSAINYYNHLKETVFREIPTALLHGQMKSDEKDSIMAKFKDKHFSVLISTTVIEVGIDIPNANIIIINDSHRFGLSQLHQLRGRVGRGAEQSYCILITKDEIAERSNLMNLNFEYLSPKQIEMNKAVIRLQSLVKTLNGFELSEIDFKLRGPGNIWGTEQSGIPEFKFAELQTDFEILQNAKSCAFNLIESDPVLEKESNKMISETLNKKYSQKIMVSTIG